MMKALEAVRNCEFKPPCTSICGGNFQTLLGQVKELQWRLIHGSQKYDYSEVFKLSDGVQIPIDYKGEFFNPVSGVKSRERGLVAIVNSIGAHSQSPRLVAAINELFNGIDDADGLDVVIINNRGLAGAELTSPRIYGGPTVNDIVEPLLYIYERFRKNSNQKLFVLGFSSGAQILASALAKIDMEHGGPLIDGACIIQPSLIMCVLKNEVQRLCSFDLRKKIVNWGFNRSFTLNTLPYIKTPSLYIFALDDPKIGFATIKYDVFTRNENVAVATTKHGGDLGYCESLFDQKMWVLGPALRFFNALNDD